MTDTQEELLKVGNVTIQTILGNIKDLHADAAVQPSGTSQDEHLPASPWVIDADVDGSIAKALHTHAPFQLGDVIITPAGVLNFKYLFSAIAMDWGQQKLPARLIHEDIVVSTARKCIKIAIALGLESIVFTPWGTRIGAIDAAHVTALLLHAISAELQLNSGNLKFLYLISHNHDHYRWFMDRTFVFQVMFNQLAQLRNEINTLDLPESAREQILRNVTNIQNNFVIYSETIGGDKITAGNISDSAGIAIGHKSRADVQENTE